jgi:hypothetical protein
MGSLLVSLLKASRKSCALAREECNKYDLTAAPCFRSAPNIMIGPSGLLLVVSHLFAVPVSASKKAVHLLAREECNKYDLTTTPYFRLAPNIMIGPGGLLLVVSHLFAVPPVSVFNGWSCEKSK